MTPSLLALLLATPAPAAAPAALALRVEGDPAPGAVLSFVVAGAQPGQRVELVLSDGPSGAGPCYPFLAGACVGILPGSTGYIAIGGAFADAGGVARVVVTVPLTASAGLYRAQAFLVGQPWGGASPPVSVRVSACADDALEPDDGPLTSRPFDAGPVDLVACPLDADWTAFDVPAGAFVEVVAVTDPADGDLDLELLALDGTVIDASRTLAGVERLLWWNDDPVEVTVFARAYVFADLGGGDGVPYTITSAVLLPGQCVDDAREDDDTFVAATVTAPSVIEGRVCANDEDWFALDATAGDLVVAAVIAPPGPALPAVALATNAGQVVGTPGSLGAGVASSDGTRYARVTLERDDVLGVGGDYSLVLGRFSGGGCPVDAHEDDDSSGAAVTITPGVHGPFGGCRADDDWFRVRGSVGQRLAVALRFLHADGDLDVEVYRSGSTTPLARGVSETDDEDVTLTLPTGGDFLIRVTLFGNDGAPTSGGAVYALGVTLE